MSSSEEEAALAFADEQLGLQESASDEQNEMAGLYAAPSVGQGYLLVTDRFGVAKMDQDSSFVCSRIQFLNVNRQTDGGGSLIYPPATQFGFSVRDAGASILVTISKFKQGLVLDRATPAVGTSVSESEFACVAQLVPQSRDHLQIRGQVDYVYTLSARWQIPRGSTIRTAFSELPANGLTVAGTTMRQYRPQLMFVGRKVFG